MSTNCLTMLSKSRSRLHNQIVQNARRIGLDVQLNRITSGDGNCWYHSVIQQISRPEILEFLEPCKVYSDHRVLRLAVVNFIREQEYISPFIQNYRVVYETALHVEYNNMSWNEFLSNQEKNGVWCTELFSQATAVFLSIDILVTSDTSTMSMNLTPFSVDIGWNHQFDHCVPC